MRLLVSVRDADEASAALAGGADIVDAKEPRLGPLAPVSPATLQAICAAVPLAVPLSVALGDASPRQLDGIVGAVQPLQGRRALFFKASVMSASAAEASGGIMAACRCLEGRTDRPMFIVARYVDSPSEGAELPHWLDVSAAAGARGLLIDTSRKDGRGLFSSVSLEALAALRRQAVRRGIWLAVAGGLTIETVKLLAPVLPHVVGVRGAACDGGRTGALSTERVARLRLALTAISRRPRPRALPV